MNGTVKQLNLQMLNVQQLFIYLTRSQAVARIADRTASQQTLVPN